MELAVFGETQTTVGTFFYGIVGKELFSQACE
jgi:hypothetical protein